MINLRIHVLVTRTDNNPGVFLLEYFLCIFTIHLNEIAGYEKIDTLECRIMGFETVLVLMAAAVSHVIFS